MHKFYKRWCVELSQFNFFQNEWLDCHEILDANLLTNVGHLYVNLSKSFFESLRFDTDSLKQYRIKAAVDCYEHLGTKPALCISGGVDSQCAWQSFYDAGIEIDVWTLKFDNDLNMHDFNDAINFANSRNIKLNILELDVLNFLSRENYEYGIKYKSQSPHFNTHYKMCNMLVSKGYTGIICGGSAPLMNEGTEDFLSNYNANFLNYINYSNVSGIYCQGNFLGFSPHLAWAISLLTSKSNFKQKEFFDQELRNQIESERYNNKIVGYKKAGFNVIPQQQKYTGFELVKKHLEEKTSDGWTFEKLYRHPLEKELGSKLTKKTIAVFQPEVVEFINNLNINQTISNV